MMLKSAKKEKAAVLNDKFNHAVLSICILAQFATKCSRVVRYSANLTQWLANP